MNGNYSDKVEELIKVISQSALKNVTVNISIYENTNVTNLQDNTDLYAIVETLCIIITKT